jgi:hypothetical protein
MCKHSKDHLCWADFLEKTLKWTPFNVVLVSNINYVLYNTVLT